MYIWDDNLIYKSFDFGVVAGDFIIPNEIGVINLFK